MLGFIKSAVGWLMDFTLDLIFIHGRRLVCRHDWRKDEIATRTMGDSPVIQMGQFARGVCRKCGKQAWLSASSTTQS